VAVLFPGKRRAGKGFAHPLVNMTFDPLFKDAFQKIANEKPGKRPDRGTARLLYDQEWRQTFVFLFLFYV
jgi:hypothetical protein